MGELSYNIRQATTRDDIDSIKSLQDNPQKVRDHRLIRHYPNHIQWVKWAVDEILSKHNERVAFTAWCGDEFVGSVILKISRFTGTVEVKNLIVDHNVLKKLVNSTEESAETYENNQRSEDNITNQETTVFKKLMAKLERYCLRRGHNRFETEVPVVQTDYANFFLSNGYTLSNNIERYENVDVYILEKKLPPRYISDPFDFIKICQWYLKEALHLKPYKDTADDKSKTTNHKSDLNQVWPEDGGADEFIFQSNYALRPTIHLSILDEGMQKKVIIADDLKVKISCYFIENKKKGSRIGKNVLNEIIESKYHPASIIFSRNTAKIINDFGLEKDIFTASFQRILDYLKSSDAIDKLIPSIENSPCGLVLDVGASFGRSLDKISKSFIYWQFEGIGEQLVAKDSPLGHYIVLFYSNLGGDSNGKIIGFSQCETCFLSKSFPLDVKDNYAPESDVYEHYHTKDTYS